MRRSWIVLAVGSAAAGLALAALAPRHWEITPVHGLLLGLALYAAALRGHASRIEEASASGEPRAWLGLGVRASVFLAVWWVQAALCFDVMPSADVRRGFVTLSAWVVAQALLGGGAPRREAERVR
jgi:hypothetical protein